MFLTRLFRFPKSSPAGAPRPRPATRLYVEPLDDRIVPAKLSVGDATLVEGNAGTQYALVSVTLDAPSSKVVSVNYATADGSARAGSDYGAASGTLTFARGETRKTIAVPVYGDRAAEPDETLFVKLSAAKNAKIADGTGVVTIRDDEPRVRINDASSAEGDSGTTLLTFTVSLSAAYDEAVTVNYSTADGSATTAGNDYLSALGTLTFAPGETSKTITVEVGGDATPEGNEYFFVNLSGASSNALLADGQGVGTILDDDGGSTPPEDDPCLWYNCHPDGGGYDTGNVTP